MEKKNGDSTFMVIKDVLYIILSIKVSVLIMFMSSWFLNLFLSKIKNKKKLEKKIKYLHKLDNKEKDILKKFITDQTKTAVFNIFKPDINGRLINLADKEILYKLSDFGHIMEGFPYLIDEDSMNYLNIHKKNLLGLND